MPYISNYCFIIEVTNLDSLLPLVARESQAQLFSFSPSQHAPPMMRTKNKVDTISIILSFHIYKCTII